jgi:hypothetical protein
VGGEFLLPHYFQQRIIDLVTVQLIAYRNEDVEPVLDASRVLGAALNVIQGDAAKTPPAAEPSRRKQSKASHIHER